MISDKNDHSYVLQTHNLTTPYLFKTLAKPVVALILFSAAVVTVSGQSCPNFPSGGSETIPASIMVNSTGQFLSDLAMVPAGSQVRIDSIATAYGECTGMACCCVATGTIYNA